MRTKKQNINPESIKQRLNNIAKKQNIDFNLILIQFFHERFLLRLSLSPYKSNFILKGALLLLSKNLERSRPTKDIDFLARKIKNSEENVGEILKTVCLLNYDDGVTFDTKNFETKVITEGAEYEGIRATFSAYLGRIERKISIDVGFGDKIINKPDEIQFPTMLTDEGVSVYGYSIETVVAEKLHASVFLGYQNSRMKDYYDLYYILTNYKLSETILSKSIEATFKARKTNVNNIKNIFSSEFKKDSNMNSKWKSYIRKNFLECTLDFEKLMDRIEIFINIKSEEEK